MIILERDGSLQRIVSPESYRDPSKDTIDVPASLVKQPNNVIDRVIDFSFSVLGLESLEVRIWEDTEPILPAGSGS